MHERCVPLAATSADRTVAFFAGALTQLHEKAEWRELHRLIVITDEQSHDGMLRAWTPRAYVVNVAPYKHGISYGNGWTHIDGWSERIIDYIAAVEAEAAA